MTTRVIGEALPNIGVGFRPSTPHERRTRDRLQQALEIVSRLAARATESECETQWALLGHLHTIPILRILHLEGSLRQWARSLAHATPVANLSAKFAGLLALPMAGEPTFPVLNPYDWPDPVLSLDDRLGRFAKQVTGAALRNAIQKATTIVRGADVPPRRAGLLRMYVLRRHGLLAPDEVWDACAAFWETIQDDPAKAVGVYGPDALRISLQFLSAADTERVARVMAYILDWKPGAVVGGMVNPDELLLLIVATAPRRIRTRAGGVRFRWTAAELVAIFNKLRDWWRTFGSDAVAKPARGGMELFDAPVLDSFISGLLDVLRILLLPSARKSGRFGRDLVQFVEELRQAKVLVGSVLPATLLVRDVADGAAVTSVLRHDLASREPDRQISALRGLISWVSLARDHTQAGRRQLPDIPLDLIREVGTQIAVRRPRVLRWGLQCARELLLLLGPSADGQFLSGLFIALDYLAAELRYGEDGPSGGEISADDVPQLRAEVARVAKVLADLGHGSAPSVASWIEAARNDPLPEVREAVTLDEDAPPVD